MIRPRHPLISVAALCAATLACALAVAAPVARAGVPDMSPIVTALVAATGSSAVSDAPALKSNAPRFDAVGYQRRSGTPYSSANTKPVQIYGGAFQPNGKEAINANFGLRGGPQIADRLQIGVMVDWVHRTLNTYTPVATPYSAGGQTVTPERIESTTKNDLVPVMAFMQVGTGNWFLSPYMGIAGGYEWLFLAAEDFETGETYYANFSGWGWQAWAGLGLPLGESIRLTGEVYHNGAIVERELKDEFDEPYKERVDVTGAGLRVGIHFGF